MREIGFFFGRRDYSRILDGRQPGGPAVLPDRLLPQGLHLLHRRVHARPCRRSAACTRATARARTRWSTTRVPAAERDGRPARRPSTSSSRSRRRSCSSRPPPGEARTHAKPDDWSSRSSGRPGVDPEVVVRERRSQSTTCSRNPRPVDKRRARAGDDAHEAHGRGPHRLPGRDGLPRALPPLRLDTLERIEIIRGLRLGDSTCSSASTSCARVSTSPRCRSSASSMPTRRASSAASLAHPDHRSRRAERRGPVLLYADKGPHQCARRSRRDQPPARDPARYNDEHGITPETTSRASARSPSSCSPSRRCQSARSAQRASGVRPAGLRPTQSRAEKAIIKLEEGVLAAAEDLRFEYAARLRDEIRDLRRELQDVRRNEAPAA